MKVFPWCHELRQNCFYEVIRAQVLIKHLRLFRERCTDISTLLVDQRVEHVWVQFAGGLKVLDSYLFTRLSLVNHLSSWLLITRHLNE